MFLAANIHFEGEIEFFFRADCCTGQTENAFGGKDPFTILDVLHDVDIHRTRFAAGTALLAVLFAPLNFKKGEP